MRPAAKEQPRARNQRVSNTRQRKQQHLLDVKVRSHTAIQHRNHRLLVLGSKIVLCLLACGAIFFGLRYGAQRLFFENPDYQVREIDVQTDGTLQREQVLKTADLREGVNIFSVNLARVHDALQQLPQVDEVQVVRDMPSSISIQIVERKPIAWITSELEVTDPFASESAFLVDARGALMKQKRLLPEYLGLPLIVGCNGESLVAGKTVESFEGKAALELLRLSSRSFMQTRFQVREIDVSKGYCLVVTDKNRTRVTFGFENLDAQLQRLEQFLVFSDDSRQELATVNLLVQRNIPVTFAKSATEIINETIDPEGMEPRILKAIPVNPPAKGEPAKQKSNASGEKPRKAVPVERGRRN
ncbi:MAG: FtsQ-type POTRA domain-containing protein [Chthoniobacterales bacterium]